MRNIGSRWNLFISVMAIFVAYGIAFAIYLHFDAPLSTTLRDDYIFISFIIILTLVLVGVLLWYTQRLDSSITKRRQEENAEMRRQLTQSISHELKTPVASIQGFLETLLDTPDIPEETRRAFLQRCHAQTLRLSALLQDISQLNRMDAPDLLLQQFEPVDISATVQRIARETALQFAERNMTFHSRLPDNLVIRGNEKALYSIFRNLMDNAIAYAGDGTTVILEASEGKKHWDFVFSDNGAGTAPEHLDRLFERFYRVDKGRSRKMGGTGLGLAIVKNSVILHRGTIKVSDARPGLRFDFSLQK